MCLGEMQRVFLEEEIKKTTEETTRYEPTRITLQSWS